MFQPYSPNLPFLANLSFYKGHLIWIFFKPLTNFAVFKILNLAVYTIFVNIATSQGSHFPIVLNFFAKPWTNLFHFCHMTVFAISFKYSPNLWLLFAKFITSPYSKVPLPPLDSWHFIWIFVQSLANFRNLCQNRFFQEDSLLPSHLNIQKTLGKLSPDSPFLSDSPS